MTLMLASFRLRLVAVMLLVTVLPVAVVILLTPRNARHAGEQLLRLRVSEAAEQVAAAVAHAWIYERSAVLDLAATPLVQRLLAADTHPDGAVVDGGEVWQGRFRVVVIDARGRAVHQMAARFPSDASPAVPLSVPVHDAPFGPAIGRLAAEVPVAALLRGRPLTPGSIGTVVGVFDPRTRAALVPLPFDLPDAAAERVEWGGDRWLLVRRALREPSVEIVAAAPITPFEQPLGEAARSSVWLLLTVAAAGLGMAAALATGMTRTLQRMTHAAEAIANGALDRQVEVSGSDEVARLARAFNRMTASLRETLQALADQRALARIGEFAASLAHEVRNPLTAIRVDLQVVEEGLPEGAASLRPLRRALHEIERLDRSVGAALLATRAARSGPPVDVREPLRTAAAVASRSGRGAPPIAIDDGPEPLRVYGDAGALEQIFLNLLLNAAEATAAGGEIRLTARRHDGRIVVRVIDSGVGISPEVARQAFNPLFTTRQDGTGLGLTIAARLAHAHGGMVSLESSPPGATATVDLPAAGTASL